MATTKYELLQALVKSRVEIEGDPAGWHNLALGVLYDIAETWGSEELLADAIFERIAGGLVPGIGDDDGA